MGRKRSYTPLNVFLNSRLVGQLVREPSGGVSFAYARDWLDLGIPDAGVFIVAIAGEPLQRRTCDGRI
ncbi:MULTISPECIES: HipA N-terminal domain-containing protein [Pseudosulfitobacter]|uniref:HipA N-terminal domain-containing protein n=1 Tax=Pseudosulfitobacter pseudonitzschiae TaxID=1402135 RepID=UPI001FD44C42|nr:HipA N-terminal domain-containing protein [Pseudosulfitobacter pseudonitzschiae]